MPSSRLLSASDSIMLSSERMANRGAMKNRPMPSVREMVSMIAMLHPDSS